MVKQQNTKSSPHQRLTSIQKQALAHTLHAQLPQTQCQRCGFNDCEAYAIALSQQKTQINRCQPGGIEGIQRLAKIMQQDMMPMADDVEAEGPRSLAIIDEKWCIGCTKCIKACPVDAIFGSSKKMHTVLEQHCTGCELCVPVCPTDCIQLIPSSHAQPPPTGWSAWSAELANNALQRYQAYLKRNKKRHKSGRITQNESSTESVAITTEHEKRDFMASILKKVQHKG